MKEINLSNFNTKNVIDMRYMFYGCTSLRSLNLYNFTTEKVIYMENMFTDCKLLKKSNIYTNNKNILKLL